MMASVLESFPPVAGPASRILILGSMPSEASLKAGQYYAHPRNLFWPIMGALLGAGPSLPYAERLEILQSSGVALWDSLQKCTRVGSLDSAIQNEVPNDFPAFFKSYPKIARVYFNGAKAEASFRRHVMPALDKPPPLLMRLPSTSPAHAAMSLADKIAAWRVVISD